MYQIKSKRMIELTMVVEDLRTDFKLAEIWNRASLSYIPGIRSHDDIFNSDKLNNKLPMKMQKSLFMNFVFLFHTFE